MNIYLITYKERGEEAKKILKKYGKVTIVNKGKDLLKYSQLIADKSPKVIGLDPSITEWQMPDEFIKKTSNLKGVCTRSTWPNYINLKLCREMGIVVTNCPGVNSQSVAEYAMWMMLSLTKKLPLQIKDKFKVVQDDKHKGEEIIGKTMGIIGLGNIGSKIAKMGKGMGMKVIYWNRKKKPVAYQYKTLETVLKEADLVFNCLQTCDETMGMLNKKRLSLLKNSAYYISVLGGAGWGVDDCEYLAKRVEAGKLAGLAVENEHKGKFPTKFNGNVFIPACYAWFTKEADKRYLKMWTDSMIGVAKGKIVNRAN